MSRPRSKATVGAANRSSAGDRRRWVRAIAIEEKSREGHVSTGFVSRAPQYVYRKVEYRLKKKKTEKVKFEAVG